MGNSREGLLWVALAALLSACGPSPPSMGAPDMSTPAPDLSMAMVSPAPDLSSSPDLSQTGTPDLSQPINGRTQVASITVSHSTNTPEVDVAVYGDGSADRTLQGAPRLGLMPMSYPANSPEVEQFLIDLGAVGDVSTIPTGHCIKSASFGTTTTVTAAGKTSGDLQCLQNPTAAETALANDCKLLTGT
jgi:hypothetical protein